MKNIVILNACNLSKYAFKNLLDNKNSVQMAVEAAAKMPDAADTAVIVSEAGEYEDCFSGLTVVKTGNMTALGLIDTLTEISEGYDNIIYYAADCALTDPGLASKMYGNHVKYFCEYTFADGYPAGISVEIIKPAVLPMLKKIAEDTEFSIARNTLFSLVEKDINAFEIETEISPDDQRLLRVSLFPDTKRNYIQLKELTAELYSGRSPGNSSPGADDILSAVRNSGTNLRSLPVFFEFEITSSHPQKISYMPAPWDSGGDPEGGIMKFEDFSKALAKIKDFADDAVISFSIRNEPSVHPDIARFSEAVLSYDNFSLLIETSGIGWDSAAVEKICSLDQERITWIVDLDALDTELYSKLRSGKPTDYREAYGFAAAMLERFPDNVYVQVIRMKQNEVDTEQFYKYWKEKTNNVIIQKYDWCCGELQQRKVTDLSPLKRLPCWHLKRETAVRLDGTVPICRDDLENKMICGNIFRDELSVIWENGSSYYKQHLNEEYPGICRNCDEYYTYNY